MPGDGRSISRHPGQVAPAEDHGHVVIVRPIRIAQGKGDEPAPAAGRLADILPPGLLARMAFFDQAHPVPPFRRGCKFPEQAAVAGPVAQDNQVDPVVLGQGGQVSLDLAALPDAANRPPDR